MPIDTVADLIAHKRFLSEIERGIQAANREVIHAAVPDLNRESFFNLAVALARLRASYLQVALRILSTPEAEVAGLLAELRQRREAFEEGSKAFEALERAIERYQDIVNHGGWPAIPGTRAIRPEDDDERLPLLRRRLTMSGDLPRRTSSSNDFGFGGGGGDDLEGAIRRYQESNGLRPTGRVDKYTLQQPCDSHIRTL